MNSSKKGVVLISFGSVLKDSNLSEDKKQSLLSIFKNFPEYDFIWKWTEDVENLPKNVLKSKWLPQQDILAHKNVVLFITHCGMHGVMESIYHGVPMLGIPIFMDQGDVLQRIIEKGIGIGIDKRASSEEIVTAVKTVIEDGR